MKDKEIAEYLIQSGFHLTALEYYAELYENGTDLTYLKEFFLTYSHQLSGSEDQGNSRNHARTASGDTNFSLQSGAESLWDDHNLLKLSQHELIDMVKEKNEKISLLEYDLRKSKEELEKYKIRVEALESNISDSATDNDKTLSLQGSLANQIVEKHSLDKQNLSLKGYEKRVLNFLVYDYLKNNNYKFTKVSFSDEVDDQDLEDWNDTQAAGTEPRSLVDLYRIKKNSVLPTTKSAKDTIETTIPQPIPTVIVTNIKQEPNVTTIPAVKESSQKTVKSFKTVDYSLPIYKLLKSVSLRRPLDDPVAIKINELLDETASIGITDALDTCLKSFILSMPNVKKEELLPLIVNLIVNSTDMFIQNRWIKETLAIIANPNSQQRENLTKAMVKIFEHSSFQTENLELMYETLCEMSKSQYTEPKLLATSLIGHLTPFFSRDKLELACDEILLMNLKHDSVVPLSPEVQLMSCHNLAILLSHCKHNDLLLKCIHNMMNVFSSNNTDLTRHMFEINLPVAIESTFRNNCLKDLISQSIKIILSRPSDMHPRTYLAYLELLKETLIPSMAMIFNSVRGELRDPAPVPEKLPDVLKGKSGQTFVYPSASVIRKQWEEPTYGDFKEVALSFRSFLEWSAVKKPLVEGHPIEYASRDLSKFPQCNWFLNEVIQDGLIKMLFISNSVDNLESEIKESILNLLEMFMEVFGSTFKSLYLNRLVEYHLDENQQTNQTLKKAIPFYLAYMLDLPSAIENLKQRIDELQPNALTLFRSTLGLMIRRGVYRKEEIVECIFLNMLFYFSTMPMIQKRITSCQILQITADTIDAPVIVNKHILPALCNLSKDSDEDVRLAGLNSLGSVLNYVTDNEGLTQIRQIFEKCNNSQDISQFKVKCSILQAFTKCIAKVDPSFRESYILPVTWKIHSGFGQDQGLSSQDRKRLITILFHVYRALHMSSLPEPIVKETLLPGLFLLKKDAAVLGEDLKDEEDLQKHQHKPSNPGLKGLDSHVGGKQGFNLSSSNLLSEETDNIESSIQDMIQSIIQRQKNQEGGSSSATGIASNIFAQTTKMFGLRSNK